MSFLPPEALIEDVYAVAIAKQLVGMYCNYCLCRGELKRCSACKAANYCSAVCQKNDWRQHKSECKSIMRHNVIADDGIRLVMRIAASILAGDYGEIKDGCIPGNSRSFLSLEDHSEDLQHDAAAFTADYKKYAIEPCPPDDLISTIFKKVAINSFAVSNQSGTSIGISLCIKLSVANHSCKPMARVVFRNRQAILLPTDPTVLPTSLAGATHSYIDELQPIEMRRQILRQKYMFECECDGCCDEERNARMEAWNCGICVNGWMRNNEMSTCELCDWRMTREHFEYCRLAEEAGKNARATLTRDELPFTQRSDLCEKLSKLFEDTLHKYNVHRLPLLRTLYGISLFEKNISAAEKHGIELLEVMKQYQPETDAAILYHKYGLAQVMIAGNAMESARELLEAIVDEYIAIQGVESEIVHNINNMLARTHAAR